METLVDEGKAKLIGIIYLQLGAARTLAEIAD